MGKRWSLALVGLMALSLWSATVYGEHPGRMKGGHGWGMRGGEPGMMLPWLLKGANLTAEQKAQVSKIMATHRPTFQSLSQQLRTAHDEMADRLFAPGEVQAEDLTPLTQRITQIREQLMQEGLKVALEVRGILTPEQLTRAVQTKKRMKELRSEMRNLMREGAE